MPGRDDFGGDRGYMEDTSNQTDGPSGNTNDYGIDIGRWGGESDLFGKITEGMREATARDTYQPFFQIAQQSSQRGFLNQLNKMGYTAGGQASGFAGSTADSSLMTQMEDSYAKEVMAAEEGIQAKMADAKQSINQVTQANRQTALQLKGLEKGSGGGGGGGTSFICGELRKVDAMTYRESMDMMVFLLKNIVTHPCATEWYIRNGIKIINEANKQDFDWKSVKKYFVDDVLAYEKNGHHNRAVFLYIDNCLNLSRSLGLELDYVDKMWTNSIVRKLRGWYKILRKKQSWKFGIPYARKVIRYKYGI